MFMIDDKAMQALDTYNRLMGFRYIGKKWSSDEQKLRAFMEHEMSYACDESEREETIELLALGFALTADGYRLDSTPRCTVWSFDIPEQAVAHRIVTAGYVAMSEAKRAQYVVKIS